MISGTALLFESTGFPPTETVDPLPGVLVMGQSEDRTVTATTDANGKYPDRRAAGTLHLYRASSGRTVREGTWHNVDRESPGPTGLLGDRRARLRQQADRGRLVDAGGVPVPHMTVAALSVRRGADTETKAHVTDDHGNFGIGGLPAGEYLIGLEVQRALVVNELRYVPRIFFPGTLDPAATPTIALPRGARASSARSRCRREY